MIPDNTIQHGNCIELMRRLPADCVDFVLTDPPYFCRYRSRDGQRVANDDNDEWIKPAFAEMHRLLKPDSFCVSFYGWNKVDVFFAAWRAAGFRPVGHIVWRKEYASKSGFLDYTHEQTYLLAKGNPQRPGKAIADVQPWQYSGNRSHPTEKAVSILTPVIQSFSRPGDLVLDPFAGSGSTAVAASLSGRRYIGMELEGRYCAVARKRLAGAARFSVGKAA